ncbi:MAG TPA: DUF2092 domain-containing protein [Lacipirellulaceae bacterium]|nr:DUF2092 domain-containing protein [Lacipirellulaceae bacterium]
MTSIRISSALIVPAFFATLLFPPQALAEESPPAAKSVSQKQSGGAAQPKEILRRAADYLGNLPAFACRMEATLEVKSGDEVVRQETNMTMRLERPNRLALLLDKGEMGMVVVSDGKQLVQCLPILKRYVIRDVPSDFAEMTDIGVPLKFTILGTTGALIPTGGGQYYKTLTTGVTDSKYLGKEKINGVDCDHLRFIAKQFDWDIWIEEGARPVVTKVSLDLSKQLAGEGDSGTYTVTFSDWNVSPKFTNADFVFKKPADAEEVDTLIEPEPPHPLLGKPAPAFKTVDLDDHPFDLKSHLGKNVIMLDFWATWCGPCVMAMPKIDEVAKKYEGRGLVFRAVNGGEDAATIKEFLKSAKLNPPVVLDPDNEIAQAYAVEGIPQTVLIGKDGKVQVIHQGYSMDLPDVISSEIEALLAGKDLASPVLEKAKKKQPKNADQAQLAPVSGRVTLDGKPLANADIIFQPVGNQRPSVGRTDEKGHYDLTYKRGVRGALPGLHTVKVQVSDEVVKSPPSIPTRFNTQSQLHAEVKPGTNVFNFDLSSK